jgi:hypothetical protein
VAIEKRLWELGIETRGNLFRSFRRKREFEVILKEVG